jgi:hypothetical protein
MHKITGMVLVIACTRAAYGHVQPMQKSLQSRRVQPMQKSLQSRRAAAMRCWSPLMLDESNVEQVVRHIMDSFKPDDEDEVWQFGNTQADLEPPSYRGARVLKSFSMTSEAKVDGLGRLRPGAFERSSLLEKYLLEEDNYCTLALLSEWKPVAAPEVRSAAGADDSAASCALQLLLVRQKDCNWEEMAMNLELTESRAGRRRWVVKSIYKVQLSLLACNCLPRLAHQRAVHAHVHIP